MFFSTLLVLSSVLGLATAVPVNYQSSFDTPALHISTPAELHQCKPSTFSWTPTTGPYYLSISSTYTNTAGFRQTSQGETVVVPHASSASWVVDVEEGSTVIVEVKDSEGQIAETIVRTVMGGPEHCL